VQAAVAVIPGCDEASISVVTARQHVRSEAGSGSGSGSGELARVVDALREQTGQGPCLDAHQIPDGPGRRPGQRAARAAVHRPRCRELEVERISSALQRAQELTADAAEALEAAAV